MLRVFSRGWKIALIASIIPQFSFAQIVRYQYLFISPRYQFAQSLDERGFVDFALCEPPKGPHVPVCRSLSGGHNLTEEEVAKVYVTVAKKLDEEARRTTIFHDQRPSYATPLVASSALALFLTAAGYSTHYKLPFKFAYPALAFLSVAGVLSGTWLLTTNHAEMETSLRDELRYYSNKFEVGESIRNEDVSNEAIELIAQMFEQAIHTLP